MDARARLWLRVVGACVLALSCGITSGSVQAQAADRGRSTSVHALGKRLAHWVAADDEASHARALARVQQGVPPAALIAFLAAARERPDAIYQPVVVRAAAYRNVIVRGHALATLAELGAAQAERAIVAAADDHAQPIRRLACTLERMHPSPVAHEVVMAMLERDPELAAELEQERLDREDRQEEEGIVVFDEDEAAP